MCSCLATYDLVHTYLYLALVAEFTQGHAQAPVFVLSFSAIEMLGGSRTNALLHSGLCFSSDAYVVEAVDHQLIDDVIAIRSLLTGCVLCVHVCIITGFTTSVNL